MIHLLAIGTNYTGESYELPDCELDVVRIVVEFEDYCSSVTTLTGKQATRAGITKAFRAFAAKLNKGDLGLVYFSGHGTYEMIKGKRVEGIVCQGGSVIYDFEKRTEFNKRKPGSFIVAASDSCYSGGMFKGMAQARSVSIDKLYRHAVDMPTRSPAKPNAELSASAAKEVSFSTGNGGAFTNVLVDTLSDSGFNTTLPALYKRIRKALPNAEYDQTPQLQIDDVLKRRTLKSFLEAA